MTESKKCPLTVAILVGFQYGKNDSIELDKGERPINENNISNKSMPQAYPDYHTTELKWWRERLDTYDELPGVLIDLYLAYQFCLRSNPHKIIVITDVENDPNWQDVLGAFGMQLVGSQVLDFVSECKTKGYYRRYRDKEWLINEVQECSKDASRLMFYYSGHCTNGNLELPASLAHDRARACEMDISLIKPAPPTKNDSIDMTELSRHIITPTQPLATNLFIFDCCYCTDLGLPFRLEDDDVFKLCSNNNRFYTKRRILSLSSTTPQQRSISTINGSFFTRHYFLAMRDDVRNLSNIRGIISASCAEDDFSVKLSINNIQHDDKDNTKTHQQTMSIYGSHPHIENIWPWLFSPQMPYDIEIDHNLEAVVLTKYKDIPT